MLCSIDLFLLFWFPLCCILFNQIFMLLYLKHLHKFLVCPWFCSVSWTFKMFEIPLWKAEFKFFFLKKTLWNLRFRLQLMVSERSTLQAQLTFKKHSILPVYIGCTHFLWCSSIDALPVYQWKNKGNGCLGIYSHGFGLVVKAMLGLGGCPSRARC